MNPRLRYTLQALGTPAAVMAGYSAAALFTHYFDPAQFWAFGGTGLLLGAWSARKRYNQEHATQR